MNFTVFTLFPEFFSGPLTTSLLGKAADGGLVNVSLVNFRDFAEGRHKTVDEPPYGGGPGMVLKPEPIVAAFEAHPPAPGGIRIFLTPWGQPLNHALVEDLADKPDIHILCGRYEGVDERVVDGWIDLCVSIGDFVLSGGEPAAACLIDAVSRFVPGVLGEPDSLVVESFSDGLLEGPQYTRPAEFRGRVVPDVLLGGNHQAIADWRRQQALHRTQTVRPDLLDDDAG